MRLFTGIDLPEDTVSRLRQLLDRLRPLAPLRWSKAENLHITTKFIGEWPGERLEEMKASLQGARRRGSFRIELSGLGWYPNPNAPRIFWAGVQGGPELAALARDTELATACLGVPAEQREYSPHLTLARVDKRKGPPPDLAALRRAIATLEDTAFGSLVCGAFHLYLSEMDAGGSRYSKLASFPWEAL